MLKYNKVQEYWNKRSSKQGEATVGFSSHTLQQQKEEYRVKKDFVLNNLVPFDGVTLDYGCGVGRFSDTFNNYIGAELTQDLYNIALKEHPDKTVIKLSYPFEIPKVSFDQLFTSTVLQHNHNDSIDEFFKSLCNTSVSRIMLYEKDQVKAPHCVGRTTEEYALLLGRYFEVKTLKSVSHTVHGEKHTLSVFSLY